MHDEVEASDGAILLLCHFEHAKEGSHLLALHRHETLGVWDVNASLSREAGAVDDAELHAEIRLLLAAQGAGDVLLLHTGLIDVPLVGVGILEVVLIDTPEVIDICVQNDDFFVFPHWAEEMRDVVESALTAGTFLVMMCLLFGRLTLDVFSAFDNPVRRAGASAGSCGRGWL